LPQFLKDLLKRTKEHIQKATLFRARHDKHHGCGLRNKNAGVEESFADGDKGLQCALAGSNRGIRLIEGAGLKTRNASQEQRNKAGLPKKALGEIIIGMLRGQRIEGV